MGKLIHKGDVEQTPSFVVGKADFLLVGELYHCADGYGLAFCKVFQIRKSLVYEYPLVLVESEVAHRTLVVLGEIFVAYNLS